jgi:four helix bundle protein
LSFELKTFFIQNSNIKGGSVLHKPAICCIMSKQLLRSGTAIGALVREAEQAESKADFIHKLAIALKEANETEYWILLLCETNYLTLQQGESILKDLK